MQVHKFSNLTLLEIKILHAGTAVSEKSEASRARSLFFGTSFFETGDGDTVCLGRKMKLIKIFRMRSQKCVCANTQEVINARIKVDLKLI